MFLLSSRALDTNDSLVFHRGESHDEGAIHGRDRGRICFGRHKINLSTVFAGQNVGVKEVSERIWLVTFMD
jgi:hypothetical protein